MKLFSLLFLMLVSMTFYAEGSEDLLGEDEFTVSDTVETTSNNERWFDQLKISLQSDFRQSFGYKGQVELERGSLGLHYESAPWQSTYVKVEGKYSVFGHLDTLARTAKESYGISKFNDAWFQYSHQECSIKLGVQGLFWGTVDGAYAVDIITPFDTTEPLLTDYSSIRSSQNLIDFNCYHDQSELELFYIPQASLDLNSHKNRFLFDQLEDELNSEWGMRLTQHWEGIDLAFMYARLYGNTPTLSLTLPDLTHPPSIEGLRVPQFNLFGLSNVWAIDRLLIALDLAYKTKQFSTYSVFVNQDNNLKDTFEIAVGLDYTNVFNHSFHLGYSQSEAKRIFASNPIKNQQSWNISWRKLYYHDTLTLSTLGYWVDQPERFAFTFLSEYQWDDFWTFSFATQYMENKSIDLGGLSGIELVGLNSFGTLADSSVQVSVKYQF